LPTSDDNPTAGPTPVRDNGPLGVPTDTLFTLQQAIVPTNDVRELAQRLEDKGYIPETLEPPPAWYRVGAQETFWVTNVDNNKNFQVDATLQYVTDHSYFWIEDSVDFDPDDLRSLAETFENDIYPTDREFFGSEWTPGVDGDPHVYILYASGLGFNLAGYFSSADEYTPLAHEYSNAHEMFLLNADNIGLDETFTYGVLAHEFQHMIHWYRDRNESSWLNEGFSELAALLNGYYDSGFDWVFAQDPDLQLNDWPNDSDATTPHYGAGFLFVTYFLDRFGEEATQALVGDANNDLTSVDDVLASISATDDLSGQPVRADDVVLDWMLTNYIQDSSVGDGRYNYYSYNDAPSFYETEQFYRCPVTSQTRSVHQYGADYIGFNCDGNYTLHFEGSIQTGVLETDPHSGTYAFWSNKGDESDMTLTQSFDFTNQAGPLSISYWTWYDLEKDYDYLYLEASLDGENWQILTTPSGTPEDPSGNSYGWGYNGLSGGGDIARWIQETIDISQFAGQVVQLRFEYVTDAAVNGEGLLLDDISIPEIGYFSDFEADNGGWDAAGWVRIQNILPQTFRLALIKLGRQTTVEYIPLNPDVSADIPLNIGGDIDEVILVVTGTTRFTRQPAAYRFEVLP
jgi:immune inhibitor A